MRNFLLTGATALLILSCSQQQANQSQNQKWEALYHKSYQLKDIPTAITAVQILLQQDSTNALRDSLPSMYFAVQNIDACLTVTDECLIRNPDSEDLNNIKLLCLEQKGEGEKALALAENLYNKTGKLEYVYKKASMELMTNQLDIAAKTINAMMEKYKTNKDSVDIFLDQSQSQPVPIIAACWNMRGYIHIQKQQYQQAAEAYQKAIQIYPDFVMARRNLQQLIQGMQQQRR
ncbi:MAG: tetratricopeptide repeat protein [Bacteroidia bacterium]|nr:tetratricopeptide repeat protein [Bacteroidia bacterium]MCC7533286.1 tetratricopeptide repeat protein [Bacteroidia bacterium]